jgi:nucleotide-binding universal stress UspA family protein
MKVERILFPTDFSEGSSYALPFAVDLAKHYGAGLSIIHVVYDITQATGVHVPHITTDEVSRELTDWALKEIDTCCIEETRGMSKVEKKVLNGIPYNEIIKYAEAEHMDLIVMGTYGRVGIQRLIFGNTAEQVVRRAPCPVLTVRIPQHRSA